MSVDKKKELTDAFAKAGIPEKYRSEHVGLESLKIPHAKDWLAWQKGSLRDTVRAGGYIHLSSITPHNERHNVELAYLLARACIVYGGNTSVVNLPRLAALVEEKLVGEHLEDCNVLVIPGFTGDGYKMPLAENTSFRIEWLMRRWLESGGLIITQGSVPLAAATWWQKSFVGFLNSYALGGLPA